MENLIHEIESCLVCAEQLNHEPRPVISVSANSRILVIGQAPGAKVHQSGIPWNDQSGKNLREWLNVTDEDFYDTDKFAIIPMGFCYPGKGKSGDLPPRKECAPLWHSKLIDHLEKIELILLIGKYAQDYYLKEQSKKTLTDTVKNFKSYLPEYFVLPHPSPRNNIWMAKNEWFKAEVLPTLKEKVLAIL